MPSLRQIMDWLSDRVAAVFLAAYRRPAAFLISLVILPIIIILVSTYQTTVRLCRKQAMHNLVVTARLASHTIDETLQDTIRFEQLIAGQPGFNEALKRKDAGMMTRHLQEVVQFVPRVNSATFFS